MGLETRHMYRGGWTLEKKLPWRRCQRYGYKNNLEKEEQSWRNHTP